MSLDVCAHITGTVWKVETQAGAVVQEGQTLVILESMKMEMPIESPEAGTITEILAVPGQSVEEGEVLIRLEPSR